MLSDQEYLAEADRVTKVFLDSIVNGPTEWKLEKEADGVRVSSRKSDDMKGLMYRSEVILEATPAHTFAMLSPLKPYRPQWDTLLEKIAVSSHVGPHTYLVYHATKPALKGLVSARDSLDVVRLGETEKYYFVAAAGTHHPEYPPQSSYVRTFQYPAGYFVEKLPQEDRCRFQMVFHADLNMNSIVSFAAEMVKPKLMIQKVNALRAGLRNICVSDDNLGLAPDQ